MTSLLTPKSKKARQISIIIGAFLLQMFTTSQMASMGTYTAHYLNFMFKTSPASKITWINTTNTICLMGLMIAGGIMYEQIGPRFTCIFGTLTMVLGYMLASVSTQIWHLVLTQGLLMGSGAAIINGVALVIPLNHFSDDDDDNDDQEERGRRRRRRRGIVMGITISGAGIGTIWLPYFTQWLLDSVGFGWTLRITGLVVMCFCVPASFLMLQPAPKSEKNGGGRADDDKSQVVQLGYKKQQPSLLKQSSTNSKKELVVADPSINSTSTNQDLKNSNCSSLKASPSSSTSPSSQKLPIFDFKMLAEPPMWLMFFMSLFMMAGFNSATGYAMASATQYPGITNLKASILPTLIGAAHTAGTLASGYLTDFAGPITIVTLSYLTGSIVVFALWYNATTFPSFIAFSILFGFFGMNTNNTIPIITVQFFGVQRMASNSGMVLMGCVVGSLCGNIGIAKAYDIVDNRGQFRVAILLTGASLAVACLLSIANGYLYWRRRRKGLLASDTLYQ